MNRRSTRRDGSCTRHPVPRSLQIVRGVSVYVYGVERGVSVYVYGVERGVSVYVYGVERGVSVYVD